MSLQFLVAASTAFWSVHPTHKNKEKKRRSTDDQTFIRPTHGRQHGKIIMGCQRHGCNSAVFSFQHSSHWLWGVLGFQKSVSGVPSEGCFSRRETGELSKRNKYPASGLHRGPAIFAHQRAAADRYTHMRELQRMLHYICTTGLECRVPNGIQKRNLYREAKGHKEDASAGVHNASKIACGEDHKKNHLYSSGSMQQQRRLLTNATG